MLKTSSAERQFDNAEIIGILEALQRPATIPELSLALNLVGTQKNKLQKHIQAMAQRGLLLINRQHQVLLMSHLRVKPGRVVGHRDVFGFVVFDKRTEPDAYLSPEQMQKVMHGDRVIARIIGQDHRQRPVGEIVEVIERARHEIAGVLNNHYGVWVVEPDHPRIRHRVLIKPADLNGAKVADKVVAAITEPPSEHGEVRGRIERILHSEGATLLTDMALASYGIPHEFAAKVLKQARRYDKVVAMDPRDPADPRADWRGLGFVTIDGEDARDFDDAVYAERTELGYSVWVAIADVGHYVPAHSPLDEAALLRATSVYFPDRVVPMLPEELSNHLCSLMPQVDRAALGVRLNLSHAGELIDFSFSKALIHSHARLTYNQVGQWLEDRFASATGLPASVRASLQVLHEVYLKLVTQRAARGALEFDAPETKLRLDAAGEVLDVVMVKRNDAHKVIEECMILANIAAARLLAAAKLPCLYRVHAAPNSDKLADLQSVLAARQIALRWSEPVTPHMLTHLLRGLGERADRSVIETLVVRSLPQAVYQPENIGHFGLGLSHYAHFTSPIRRYPDLVVHRAIAHHLSGAPAETFVHPLAAMLELGELCSQRERRADEATRDVVSGLKCRWLAAKVGEEFTAQVTGVVEFGLFVQLEPYFMDGLIHISTLGHEYFAYHADRLELVGEMSGKRYRLGDRLSVRVASVDERARKVDVVLSDYDPRSTQRRPSTASRLNAKRARAAAPVAPVASTTSKQAAKRPKHAQAKRGKAHGAASANKAAPAGGRAQKRKKRR